jgi:hypothetical protein
MNVMPSNSNFPFAPADSSQQWQARGLPRILVQPNAPANAGSTNPAGSDGIDDWFVPTPAPDQDGLPDDWFVPGNAGAVASPPGDASNPSNANVPAPAAAPNPSAPNPQSSAATPSASNQPAPRPDPFAAYWSLIPASRAGAMAWHPPIFLSPDPFSHENIPASAWVTPPPIFLNSPGQPPFPGPAPLDYSLPAYGLFRGIAKMSAASAPPDLGPPSAAHGLFGGIAKWIAASAALDPLSLSGPRGFLGSLADLPVPLSAQAASHAPYSGPFLSPDPIGFHGGSPPYAFLRNDLPTRADLTRPIPDQPPTDQAFGAGGSGEKNVRPNYLLVAGDEEEEKERSKPDPAVLSGLTDEGLTASPKAMPPVQLPLPLFPRSSLPQSPAPQASPRPPLLYQPPPNALPPPSPGQATNGPRASGTTNGPAPASESDGESGNAGIGDGGRAVLGPPSPSAPSIAAPRLGSIGERSSANTGDAGPPAPALGDAARAVVAACDSNIDSTELDGLLRSAPADYANARAAFLQNKLAQVPRAKIAIAVGIVEDKQGGRRVIIGQASRVSESRT